MMYVDIYNKANAKKTKEHELRLYTGRFKFPEQNDFHIFGFGTINKIARTSHIEQSMCNKVLETKYNINEQTFNLDGKLNTVLDTINTKLISDGCCDKCSSIFNQWTIKDLPKIISHLKAFYTTNTII